MNGDTAFLGITEWILDKESVPFHQSNWWGRLKSKFGWQVLELSANGTSIQVYIRKLLKIFSFAYIPFPVLNAVDAVEYCKQIDVIAQNLKSKVPKSCLFLRFDMPLFTMNYYKPSEIAKMLDTAMPYRFVKGGNVQPPDTVVLNLTQSEDAILLAMKPKWRYNIRLAEKKGVEVLESDGKDLEIFWNLYEETSKRDRISIHSKAYYQAFFDELVASNNTTIVRRLWIARYLGEPISAIITVYCGNKATYLYGASSNSHRNVMAPYLLQWHALRDAKLHGCTSYDFYGMSPTEDPDHPMYGLYRFKTGFGGEIRHYMGCLDVPVKILLYRLFLYAEKMRSWWYKSLKKKKKKSSQLKSSDNES